MLSQGARQLPLRHLSIRVPWHDTDWTGRVCQNPCENLACLILPRIRENRDDEQEERIAGKSWQELRDSELPPCVSERANFMAPYELIRKLPHPYAKSSPAHANFIEPRE